LSDLESNLPVEEPLEDAVDDLVPRGTAVCLGSTLCESIDDAVLTEVFEPVGYTDSLPCAENVREPLEDAVVLRDRVGTVEVDGEGVLDLVLRLVDVSVGTAEEDRDGKEDLESV
jgi:hypothetical protein